MEAVYLMINSAIIVITFLTKCRRRDKVRHLMIFDDN